MKIAINIKDVRDNLAEVAAQAWENDVLLPRAELVVKAMGKINQSLAIELNNAALLKVKPNIPFLNYDGSEAEKYVKATEETAPETPEA
jgi:hypothetical protein